MRILTYHILETDSIHAITQAEFDAGKRMPEDWDDFIWQNAPSTKAAIARHDDALDLYIDDANAGRPTKDTYTAE